MDALYGNESYLDSLFDDSDNDLVFSTKPPCYDEMASEVWQPCCLYIPGFWNDSQPPYFERDEKEMQRAGQTSDHQFRDMRSARHAYQRTRKYPRKKRSRKQDRVCGFHGYERNGRRVHNAKENRHHVQYDEWIREYHYHQSWQYRWGMRSSFHHRLLFGTWRDAKKIGEGEEGEDFGMWGRRRIEEMRRVKEDRLRKQQSADIPSAFESTVPPHITTTSVPNKAVSTTTLPTDPFDIEGHRLLRSVLTLNEYTLRMLKRQGKPPFLPIKDYRWFGEFDYKWHKNGSGCWEFGQEKCSGPLPCKCCANCYIPCYCEEFEGEPSPEDVQRCALVEWTLGKLRELLEKEHAVGTADNDDLDIVGEEDDSWELFSDAASQDWSVVSEQESFAII